MLVLIFNVIFYLNIITGVIVILYPHLTWPVSAGNMYDFSVNTVYAKKQIEYGSLRAGTLSLSP